MHRPVRYYRADIHTTLGESYLSVIFAFAHGAAAIWRKTGRYSAERILFVPQAVFVPNKPTKAESILHIFDGDDWQQDWTIRALGGGGCCGANSSFSVAKLLDPNRTQI